MIEPFFTIDFLKLMFPFLDGKEEKQIETLDIIRILESKFTVLCRVAFEISFKVINWDPNNEDELVDTIGTSSSQGTSANTINIDEDKADGPTKEQGIPSVAGLSRPPET